MYQNYLFEFTSDLSSVAAPDTLNNPFGEKVPAIAKLAAREFYEYVKANFREWEQKTHDICGKMLGVLVVKKRKGDLAYLGAISGNLRDDIGGDRFTPSVFDVSTDDYFINRGMTELTALCKVIDSTEDKMVAKRLIQERSNKSKALQEKLFDHYNFLNINKETKNLWAIFKEAERGNPPSGSGECAAPKMLHFAIQHDLKPVAIAEFWCGKTSKGNDRIHHHYYPACIDKCKPILEYMLDDDDLYANAKRP